MAMLPGFRRYRSQIGPPAASKISTSNLKPKPLEDITDNFPADLFLARLFVGQDPL